MTFQEKNTFVIKYKDELYFYKDLELFKKYFPAHRLNNELARANIFTFSRLDGQMLNELLNKITPDAILKNRESDHQSISPILEAPEIKQALSILGFEGEEIDKLDSLYSKWLKSHDNQTFVEFMNAVDPAATAASEADPAKTATAATATSEADPAKTATAAIATSEADPAKTDVAETETAIATSEADPAKTATAATETSEADPAKTATAKTETDVAETETATATSETATAETETATAKKKVKKPNSQI